MPCAACVYGPDGDLIEHCISSEHFLERTEWDGSVNLEGPEFGSQENTELVGPATNGTYLRVFGSSPPVASGLLKIVV